MFNQVLIRAKKSFCANFFINRKFLTPIPKLYVKKFTSGQSF